MRFCTEGTRQKHLHWFSKSTNLKPRETGLLQSLSQKVSWKMGRLWQGKEEGEARRGKRGVGTGRRQERAAGAGAVASGCAPVPDNTAMLLGPGYRADRGDCNVHSTESAQSRRMGAGGRSRMPPSLQAKRDPPRNTAGSYGQREQGLRNSLLWFSGAHARHPPLLTRVPHIAANQGSRWKKHIYLSLPTVWLQTPTAVPHHQPLPGLLDPNSLQSSG